MRTEDELRALEAARIAPRFMPAGRTIYRSGETSPALFNVISGWLYFFAHTQQGRRQILGFALPGETIGSQTLVNGGARHSAATLTDAVLCPLPWDNLEKLIREHPALDRRVAEPGSGRSVRSLEQLGMLAWLSSRERVIGLLFDLAQRSVPGRPLRRGEIVSLPLTQQHIADATGITAIHVNRTLRELREAGVCRFERGVFKLCMDPEGASWASLSRDRSAGAAEEAGAPGNHRRG